MVRDRGGGRGRGRGGVKRAVRPAAAAPPSPNGSGDALVAEVEEVGIFLFRVKERGRVIGGLLRL